LAANEGGKGHWRQSDIKRAIAAAEAAGLAEYRVEIAPDGTIAIIVGAAVERGHETTGREDLAG
jgi:hypothetical protein